MRVKKIQRADEAFGERGRCIHEPGVYGVYGENGDLIARIRGRALEYMEPQEWRFEVFVGPKDWQWSQFGISMKRLADMKSWLEDQGEEAFRARAAQAVEWTLKIRI